MEAEAAEPTAAAPGSDQEWGIDISPERDGGVWKKVLVPGESPECPVEGNEVHVHYVGRLLTGEVFDSSRDRGELFTFKLGEGKVIKGWDIGVATMTKGEKSLLTCKAAYAYGDNGSPPSIPPAATLQFEVELFRWVGEDVMEDGGVMKSVLAKGEAYLSPPTGSRCTVRLRGSIKARVFQEKEVTYVQGEGPEKGVVDGVEKAVGKMKKGETARLTLRPDYAYGEAGHSKLGVPPNTEVTFVVTLVDFEKAKRPWEYDTPEERRVETEEIKEKGNTYFKAGKYTLALRQYDRASDNVGEDALSQSDEFKERKGLRISLHLNQAACHLKLQAPAAAIKECEEVLKEDSVNVKGYFRRGQAQVLVNDYEEAESNFLHVLQLEPGNKAARSQLAVCRSKLRVTRERERKMYANMFKSRAPEDKEGPGVDGAAETADSTQGAEKNDMDEEHAEEGAKEGEGAKVEEGAKEEEEGAKEEEVASGGGEKKAEDADAAATAAAAAMES